MRRGSIFLPLLALLLPGTLTAAALRLVPHFPDLSFDQPVAMVALDGAPARWLVVGRRGRIVLVEGSGRAAVASAFADLGDRVEAGPGEAGLLGIALHPKFAQNRTLFLSYTRRGTPLVSVIARYTTTPDGRSLDPASAQTVLEVAQPFSNHNGGNIAFGPDGYLYIGFGDGGAAGDPQGNGQNLQSLLGKMLRLDVDGGAPYAIPADNPFSKGGGRAEIWAWGLRNPWRWSFDRQSGLLWAGDVGQNQWEEIDIIRRGGNYGWNRREGRHCYRHEGCGVAGLSEPLAEYGHEQGCSVTGGYVYRGAALPALGGHYLYTDFCSGRLWALEAANPERGPRLLLESGLRVGSFAEGPDGELYLLDLEHGRVYRLAP